MTTPVDRWQTPDRVGGTNGGGRHGEAAPLSEVISGVLTLLGNLPMRVGTQEVLGTRNRARVALSVDPDLSYLADKVGLHPSLVASMLRHYGRPVVAEAMRCSIGRPTHPAYFAAVCRRISEGRP